MPFEIFPKTDALSRANALVVSQTLHSPVNGLVWVYGEELSVNIKPVCLTGGVPGYDPTYALGTDLYTLKVGLGIPGGVPTTGTYTLTFGGQTTTALDYNSTAAQIQAALVALSSIGAGNVNVKGLFPTYEVQFIGDLANASQALITANDQLLFPDSTVNILRKYEGSGVQDEIQVLNITLDAVSLQTTWTNVPATGTRTGFNGILDFGTPGIAELFPLRATSLKAKLDIVVISPDGVPKWLAQVDVTILARVVNPESSGYTRPKNYASGTVDISNAVNTVTVSGLALGSIPRQVSVTIRRPAGESMIFANVVHASVTSAGFTAELSAITDSANFKLDYELFF